MTPRPARRSLADAFTPAPVSVPDARAAGLGGLLPPRPKADVSVVVRPAALTAVVDDDRQALAGERDRAPDLTSTGVSGGEADADPDRVRNVAVYLRVDLLDRLKRTRRSRELTYADLLVEAAAAHLESLSGKFASAPSPAAAGMPSRARRKSTEPGVQVQIRLDGHQLRWLDEQMGRLGAPSRTALVAALLEVHLASG